MSNRTTDKNKLSDFKPEESVQGATDRIHRTGLLRRAVYVENEKGGVHFGSEDILRKMLQISEKGQPAWAEDRGQKFVIEANTSREEALLEWKEQVCMPWLKQELKTEKDIKSFISHMYDFSANFFKNNREADTRTMFDAALAEFVVTEHPKYADKLSIFRLANALNCVQHYKDDDPDMLTDEAWDISEALLKKTKKFIAGEEIVDSTIKNVLALSKMRREIVFAGGRSLIPQFMEHVAQIEQEMLQHLQPKDLQRLSDKDFSKLKDIAAKHDDKGEFKDMFVHETVSRFMQMKTSEQHK